MERPALLPRGRADGHHARRVAALEQSLGIALFERTPLGYVLTETERELLGSAELAEQGAVAFETAATADVRAKAGELRISTNDALVDAVVTPAIAEFRKAFPKVRIHVDVTSQIADLVRGDADVALRSGVQPHEPSVVHRRLPGIAWGVYCGRGYVASAGRPSSLSDVHEHPVASLDGAPLEDVRRIDSRIEVVQVTNTVQALIATLKGHDCIAGLPCLAGDVVPELERCFVVDAPESSLCLAYHERLRRRPDIRALGDAIAEQVNRLRLHLKGRGV